jgi:hypothetical protein
MLLVRVLRRWNFGPEFWVRREHSTGCLFTPAEQAVYANSHRSVTLAVLMLLNRDERSRTTVCDNIPRAGAVLMNAASVHSGRHDKVIEAEMDRYCSKHKAGSSSELQLSSLVASFSRTLSRPPTRA